MTKLYNKISYIVCYREASIERKKALLYTIKRFRKLFPSIEIIVVEQDSESKFALDETLNIRHLFLYNPGLFNRSWAFNCAVKNSTKDIFIFIDGDIFLEKEDYIKCFEATFEFEAITPHKVQISNVSIDEDGEVRFLNMRKLHTFAGGILIMTRSGFEKIGGWDERFEGWGGEDDAITHVIYSRLKSKTFNMANYHIDHPHENVTGDNHPQYESNKALWREIKSMNGPALGRYIKQLKNFDLGNTNKYTTSAIEVESQALNFILAITTYNRLAYLKECVTSFLSTKSDDFSWQIIIADDNSTDGTQEYLKKLEEDYGAIIIRNDRSHIHHQVNTIIKRLSQMTFHLCFKCDDDIRFVQKGWDHLYWNAIQRTRYDHLIFYDKKWQPHVNLSRPIRSGNLVSNSIPENIQGGFYTITKEVIEKVGYFDVQNFGVSGLGHVDFSFRNCRAGFNVLESPFDVEHSNEYLQLQSFNSYKSASSLQDKSNSNSADVIAIKKQVLKMGRVYIPYNEHLIQNKKEEQKLKVNIKSAKKAIVDSYQKADATFYPERGISGALGFVFKRLYNLSIDLKLFFIPNSIKFIGKFLNKIGIHLLNIDQ